MSRTDLAVRVNTVRDMLNQSAEQIRAALPEHMNATRLARIAMTTFQRNPTLLECDPKTLIGQVIQCAQLGLEPDGILGGAYLVPFRNNKLGKMDVQLIVGYKGLIDLARRSGQVSNIYARVVYENEPFSVSYGLKPDLQHTPMPPAKRGKEKVGVYAVAVLTDGNVNFEFLYAEEVEAIRKQSRASKDGPWQTHEEEMWKKTAIRRLAKTLPLSPEFARAAAVDEQEEIGVIKHGAPMDLGDVQVVSKASTVKAIEEKPEPQANNELEPTPQERLHAKIMTITNGDMFEAEALCEKITGSTDLEGLLSMTDEQAVAELMTLGG